MKIIRTILLASLLIFSACSKKNDVLPTQSQHLTIFCVNDVHGQIDNFSKVKHIIDAERQSTNILVVSAGDLFSGNPVVDNYDEKGFPLIDIMNEIGFDISALGNHDFDYGPETLKARVEQSTFPWICANAVAKKSDLHQFDAYTTLTIDDLRITFLGLLETNGSNTEIIPSSHPWRVAEYTFTPAENMIGDFASLKTQENADLLIALSHLGEYNDFQMAIENSFIDVIIGGHTHAKTDTILNNIPIVQAGGYLNYLGKIELEIQNKEILSSNFTIINLNNYTESDADLHALINEYNDWPELYDNIGYAELDHSVAATGCFYTHALREHMNADVSFQNTGGVRSSLKKGKITKRDIYEISPFNNGTVLYKMSVEEIKDFLKGSGSGFYYSGISIQKAGSEIIIRDELGRTIPDNYALNVGINDYIPAVHSLYFPAEGEIQPLTAAETIIAFLESNTNPVNFSNCYNYFRY